MSKTATVKVSMEPEKKEKVAEILRRLGMTHSEAINVFCSLVEECKGLPFAIRIPDDEAEGRLHIRPEVLKHLRDSIEKNRRLGELLAK